MHTVVAAARANGLRCMDGPYAAFKDAAGLERASKIARALGFDGKQCIHPAQLPVVNAVFGPSDEEVARAEAVVKAYEDAVASGQGAVTHDGRMIDAASLRMARCHPRPPPFQHSGVTEDRRPETEDRGVLPLEGMTVVAVEQAVAAPFASRQLADLGARVIKVERPGAVILRAATMPRSTDCPATSSG